MIERGAAESLAQRHPDLALSIAPGFERALVAKAGRRLAMNRTSQAEALARQAVGRDPLDVAALRTFAFVRERQGRVGDAERIMSMAGRRSWRDGLVHAWLFQNHLRQGRIAEAMDDADSLLRREYDPPLREKLFAVLTAMAAYPADRAVLVERLGEDPPWRGAFLAVAARAADPDPTRSVLAGLRLGPKPPTADEITPIVSRLTGDRRYGEALAEWNEVSRPGASPGALMRDGDFAAAADGTAFTWSAEDGPGATTDVESAPGDGGRHGLRVEYDGYSTPSLPRQLLILSPGRYRLSWLELNVEGTDPDALTWAVKCADDGRILATAPPAHPMLGMWRRAQLDFAAPVSSCEAQWLQLTPIPGERRTTFVRWFTAMRLEPLA